MDDHTRPSPASSLPGAGGLSCPVCNTPVSPEQRFCGNCGASLRLKCGHCGAENPLRFRFCGNCGNALAAQPPQPSLAPQRQTLRDERRWATVLFADVSGFTALAEQLDPEEVKAFADRCARRMSQEVQRFGGAVLRIVGDEVLAAFGVPVAHEDDAERAVRAALAMRDLNLTRGDMGAIRVHVGINTGEVMAGAVGLEEYQDYTVHGDVVNTAARLRSAAPSGVVLVGEETHRATQHAIRYRPLESITARGKEQPVRAWEALEAVAAPAARPLGAAPLLGREDELARLQRMWARVLRDAQPHLVTIIGEPGIGKSRLVAEFEQSLQAHTGQARGLALHGRCLPYGEALPYGALAQAFKEAAAVTADHGLETARGMLGALVEKLIDAGADGETIARHMALLTGLDLEPDRQDGVADQRLLHQSARLFLQALAGQQPLCLIIDDIQWAGDALLDLIEHVAARVREAPLLIVTQARPELMEKRPTWGRSVLSFTSLWLAPLSAEHEHELLLALLRQHGLPPDMAGKVRASVGGNPLFAEELVAMIAESGTAAGVPSVIKLLIAARLDTLPPEERRAMQLAAVLGKVFWQGGVRALGAGDTASLLLDALEQKNLVRAQATSQIRGDREYTFKHDLIRDVAYEMLPKAERRTLHGRLVEWFEQTAADQLEAHLDRVAHHAVEAGQPQRAIAYLERAAGRASRAAAFRQAADLLSQAIALVGQVAASDAAGLLDRLMGQRAQTYLAVGLWDEAGRDLRAQMERLAPDQHEARVRLLLDLARTRFWLLDTKTMRQYSAEALALAEEMGRDDLAASATANLAVALSSDGDSLASLDLYDKALARAQGRPILYSSAPSFHAVICYWLGRHEQAVAIAERSMVQSESNPTDFIYDAAHLALALAGRGRYRQADEAFDRGIQMAREFEAWPFGARTIAMSAGFRNELFDFAGSAARSEEACEIARSIDFAMPVASASMDLLFNYARRQEPGRAEAMVDEVTDLVQNAAGFHGWMLRMRLLQAQAEIALASERWQSALELARQALAQSQAHGRVKYQVFALETGARALAALGRKYEAIANLRQALDVIRPSGDPATFLRAAAPLLDLDGDDALAAETLATVERIQAALPDDAMRRSFLAAAPVQRVLALAGR